MGLHMHPANNEVYICTQLKQRNTARHWQLFTHWTDIYIYIYMEGKKNQLGVKSASHQLMLTIIICCILYSKTFMAQCWICMKWFMVLEIMLQTFHTALWETCMNHLAWHLLQHWHLYKIQSRTLHHSMTVQNNIYKCNLKTTLLICTSDHI